MPFVILGIVVVVILIWFVATSNSLRRAVVKIEEAESGIDVALTKRYDVLTKMLDVAKNYANYEKATILETIQVRRGMSMEERAAANEQMSSAFEKIYAVAEAYPDLKSSENFRQLQVSIMDVEEHLQAARRAYNGNVSAYNQSIVSFPTSLVASMLGMGARAFFQAEEAKRQDVEMKW